MVSPVVAASPAILARLTSPAGHGASPNSGAASDRDAVVGAALLAAAMIASLAFWWLLELRTGLCLEDALISFRYAANIASGDGFVFNAGERVLGTTTPLFTLLLALGAAFAGSESIPVVADSLAIFFGQAAGLATYALLHRSGSSGPASALGAAWLLFQPSMAAAAIGGMETTLVLALMAASLLALCAGRGALATAACALLVLTRVDGLLWTTLVMGTLCLRRPGSMPRHGAIFLGLVAPWALFAQFYFGSPIPHSVAAKALIGAETRSLTDPELLSAHLRWFIGATGIHLPRGAGLGSEVVAAALAIWIGTGVFAVAKDRRSLLALVWFPPLLCTAYYIGGAPRIHPWYLMPPLWCSCVLGAIGVAELPRLLRFPALVPRRWRTALYAAPAVALLAVHLAQAGRRELAYRTWQQSYEDGLRRRLGEWLRANTPADATVATEAIGYQGYYSGRRIFDLGGLVSPEVVSIARESSGSAAIFHEVLRRMQPDFLVLRSMEVDRNHSFHGGPLFETPAQRDYFVSHYREVGRFSAPDPRPLGPLSHLTVYARRSPRAASPAGGEGVAIACAPCPPRPASSAC